MKTALFTLVAGLLLTGVGCTSATSPKESVQDVQKTTSVDAQLATCQSFENGSTQQVVQTNRIHIDLPKAVYPQDIISFFSTKKGNATAGYIASAGEPGLAENAPNGCWSTYVEFNGVGEVDLTVKSIVKGLPDYHVVFTVEEPSGPLIGGDGPDEHGCFWDGGYTWCERKQKCLRSWEESCWW